MRPSKPKSKSDICFEELPFALFLDAFASAAACKICACSLLSSSVKSWRLLVVLAKCSSEVASSTISVPVAATAVAKDAKQASEEVELDQILADLEEEEAASEESFEGGQPMMDEMAAFAVNKKKTVALLKELVKIASELDEKGQYEDATEIDNVIKEEVQTLLTASKK